MANSKPRQSSSEADGADNYTTYLDYNRTLRTWFVAFGIGGPAIFLTNADLTKRLAAQGDLRLTAILFLIGAACQVLGAFVNKVANWYVYESAHPKAMASWKYRLAEWVIEQFWFDILMDVVTILCFGRAAWELLTAFAR